MSPRNTLTGKMLEQMVIPALNLGGYECQSNVVIGPRPSGKRHRIDVLATRKDGKKFLISLKWQQVGGTAEEKIPYEVVCLAHSLRTSEGEFSGAYLVLGGEGWSLKDFYLGGGLHDHLRYGELVKIMDVINFASLANQGNL